jgi:homoserine O-acetyltransferase
VPVREGIAELPGVLLLHHGGQLADIRVAWRLTGSPEQPLVIALGGISAGRLVFGAATGRIGWWNELVGPGRALDASRYQILGVDFLGGSGETTGPRSGQADFPAISAYDQAEMLRRLLDTLCVPRVHAIVGASYGGMVALAFAEKFGDRVAHIIAISAAERAHPLSTAWRSVQRAIVRYSLKHNEGPEGLRLARALAMATYRSADEFAARFGAAAVQREGHFQFPVESYLLARGDVYAQAYIPEAFVCLSESIDLYRVDATRICVPTTLVAIHEDQLVPLADMRALKARLSGPVQLIELSSLYGHDAFLKEGEALTKVFAAALQGKEAT